MSYPQEPCECELPSSYYTGVPGILAATRNGRVARDAVVVRCDLCRRYASDAVARAKLRELGLCEVSASEEEPPSFTVQCYAVVRVEFPGVVADDAKAVANPAALLNELGIHQHAPGVKVREQTKTVAR